MRKQLAEKVFTSPTLGANFILVLAGRFTMGSPSRELETQDLLVIRHDKQTISQSFYMQTTEVTQGQWKRVMGTNPSHFNSCGDDCPVESVSWDDVQDFIHKLNNMEGTDKYGLPTEVQWEYAARSGGEQEEYAGTTSDSNLGDYAWYSANSDRKTHPVGQKKPNGLGLYDMSGNVCEWVQDWYGAYPVSHVTFPSAPSSDSARIYRSGGWRSQAKYCRTTLRYSAPPVCKSDDLGFRLARTS